MTRDEKKEWLNRFRSLLCRAAIVEAEVEEAKGRVLPASPSLDGMPRGSGHGSAVERTIAELSDLEIEWQRALKEAFKVRNEILHEIQKLPETEYAVLRLRYLDHRAPWRTRTWREISEEIYMSENRVRHVHGEAVDHLNVPINDQILYGDDTTN